MYRFIKFKDISLPRLGEYDYMLYCDSVKTLTEHTEMYSEPTMLNGLKDYIAGLNDDSIYTSAIKLNAKINETDVVTAHANLLTKTFFSKLKCINQRGHILLRECGSFMFLGKDHAIVDEIWSDKMIFPSGDYSVRIIKWPNGSHYYAKVGTFDVVDEFGNQKWNTMSLAEEEANKFKVKLLDVK